MKDKVIYINLFTSGRLNAFLADIDKQVQERNALEFAIYMIDGLMVYLFQ